MYLSKRKNQLNPLFDFVFGNDFKATTSFSYSSSDHISQDENAYTLSLELAGYQKEDFQIEIKDDQLFVFADLDESITETNRYRKSFRKIYNLDLNNIDVDNVVASYEAGILEISLPKSEKLMKKIAISVN